VKEQLFILNFHFWAKTFGFFLCFFCHHFSTQAQEIERCQWIKYQKGKFQIDSLSIVPNSFSIKKAPNSELTLWYDFNTNEIEFSQILSENDSIFVCYKVFPFKLNQKYYKRDVEVFYDSSFYYSDEYLDQLPTFSTERNEIFALEGFQKSGNLSRGISFGNTQNVFVNSALNLQLEGNLTKDLKLRAIISDQNVPFQPDGNTQQIQEFDRVFVQLIHTYGTLTAGDIVLQNPESYFLKYYKNVQGGFLSTNYDLLKGKAQTQVGGAASRGKFANIQIEALEGVQGPYKITSPNGENFIIILANSERVFLDGRQLQRGFNNDYIIDYNLGEITFTNQILITQFSRIGVDFEYAERNYARNLITASHYQTFENFEFFVNFYQESDNAQNTLGLELSDNDRQALQEAGDFTSQALISGSDSLGFQEGLILYKQIDTTINNIVYQDVFVYSINPSDAFYQVRFTEVGFGNGDYSLQNSLANGLVFQWQAPVNGVPQGNFAPVIAVPTPVREQLTNFGGTWFFDEKKGEVYAELALSSFDKNLFSDKNDEDNQGLAFKTSIKHEGKNIFNLGKGIFYLSYEQNDENFNPIDRFRPIEFERDWGVNLISDTTQKTDKIFTLVVGVEEEARENPQANFQNTEDSLAILIPIEARNENINPVSIIRANSQKNRLKYRFTFRDRNNLINGWQQEADFFKRFGIFRLQTSAFLLQNENPENKIYWERLKSTFSIQQSWGVLGYTFEWDKNQILNTQNDSLQASLMNFESHQFFLENSIEQDWKYRLSYTQRRDFLPLQGEFQEQLFSHTLEFQSQKNWQQKHFLGLQMIYRKLEYTPEFQIPNQANENLSGRIDVRNAFWEGNIRQELTLGTATGLEPQREFIFLPVPNGQGTHTWRDDNGDGLQSLNEFYLARNPDEQNYIKVFSANNNFISAFSSNFLYRLQWRFPKSWRKKSKTLNVLSRVSQVFSWTINRRVTDEALDIRFLPFVPERTPEDLLSTQEIMRSTVFFNRGSAKFGFDLGLLQTRQKQLLTNGFEETLLEEYNFSIRKNIGRAWNLTGEIEQNFSTSRSDFLFNRNYQILSRSGGLAVAFQPSQSFRITLGGILSERNNLETEAIIPEKADIQELNLELRWTKVSKRNLNANLRYLNINYQGDENTPVAYEILEALQNGENWVWNVNWQQNLSNGLQLILVYEGRKSPTIPVVHIGRVQLSALF